MTTAEGYPLAVRRLTLTWFVTALALFLVLVLLGLTMRGAQADVLNIGPDYFYGVMTLHGLGMSGTLLVSALAGVWYLLSRLVARAGGRVAPYNAVMWGMYLLTVVGVVGLLLATLPGRFAAGWYLLYPLPFVNATWPEWSTGLAIISLMGLGTAWLVMQGTILAALGKTYGYRNLLGWQYFTRAEPQTPIPPIVLISTVSLIAGIITTVVGAVFLLLCLIQWLAPTTQFDPLLLKNLVFLFGHTIVNITMYFGVAMVYELMPRFSGRPWPTNKVVATAWNISLIFVLGAYFHHLYMDFVQPQTLQYLGQIFSYASSVPATVVTIFGMISQVYRSGLRWSFVPLTFLLGFMGWVIGGFAAVVDSTIAVNTAFHNTMWVPAHFHTYFLMGYVLILFGAVYLVVNAGAERLAKTSLAAMLVGGYGFLAMFYVGGVAGVPRRYATYEAIPLGGVLEAGQTTASLAVAFALLYLVGLGLYFVAVLLPGRAAPLAATAS